MRVYINGIQAQTTSAFKLYLQQQMQELVLITSELSQYLSGSISSFAFIAQQNQQKKSTLSISKELLMMNLHLVDLLVIGKWAMEQEILMVL